MKRTRLFPLLLLGMLVIVFAEVNEARAAVAHDAASESHTLTTGSTNQASFTWTHTPVGTPRGVLVFVYTISATSTVTSVTYGGVAMTAVSGGAALDNAGEPGRVDTFFLGASVPTGAQSVVVNRTNNAVVMYATAITQTAAADTEVTGIILLQTNTTLALTQQNVTDGSPGINSVRYAGAYSGLAAPPTVGANSTLLHNIDFGNFGTSTVRETTAGQGARLVGFTAAADDAAAVHLAVRERTTTIATGTDPGATTVPPDSGAQTAYDANPFTLQTSTGTETITSVTVNLSTNSGVARLAITDAANVELGFTTSPVTGSNAISVSGMSAVSGSATTFKVRVTPLSHAAMDVPPGGAYTITAPVTAWAGNYTGRAGSDTDPNAVTIDNLSPAEVTVGTTTEGNTQITLNWTNPGGDFSNVVILRNTVAISDVPAEGSAPAVNATIGTGMSVVRYILGGTTFTDTSLTNGTAYFYKIFAKDTSGNYSAAPLSLGPFTPSANCFAVATGNWTASATWSSTSGGAANTCSGAGGIPDGTISAFIGETATAYTVTIPAVTTATAADVTIGNATSVNGSKALTLAASTSVLNVTGNINIHNPLNNGNTNALNVDAGTVSVGGNVALNGTSANNARIARIQITTGTLTVSGGLTYTAAGAARAVIVMSGGAGTLNLAGALTVNNGANQGTLTPGTTSTVNFNGAVAQTIPIGVSSVVYNNLHVNNTHASGATLGAAITAGDVTGNLRVQGTGILNNGGFGIVGSATAGDTFEVENGARFNLSGTSAIPTGFTTRTFGATSTVNFNGGNQTVASGLTYGHLILDGGSTKTMAAGTTTIAGDFTLGTGTTRAATNNPTVNLAGNFTNNGTFNAGTGVFTFDGSASKTITGVTTFGNLTFDKTGGATVTANSNLSIVRNFTNTAGFDAGTTTTIFSGTIDQTITGATTFHSLTLNNNNASGTELNLNNDVTVNNTLAFTQGNISTGTNTLVIGNTTGCGVTGAAANRHVVGNLRKNFTGTLLSCTFEIGDGVDYLPVDVAFGAVNTAGTLTVSMTTTGSHPQIGSSAINSAADVNLYWTLVRGGTLDFTNYTTTFRYSDGSDPDGTTPSGTDHNDDPAFADDPGYMIQRYEIPSGPCVTTGGTWNNTTLNSPEPTSRLASAMAINSIGTCSQFAVGAPTVASFVYEKEFIYTREIYY